MNEMTLSNDLKQIELEITHHKNIAGQSIWEIGRRLNHVKANDLVHGEFIDWVESIGMSQTQANRFMKVALELKKPTSVSLGLNVLYLIATLPEEERETEHVTDKGETKSPEEMTVRELQELKKQLKDKEELHQRIVSEKDNVIEKSYQQIQELQDKEPEVVEKEVIPEDYEANKQRLSEIEEKYKKEIEHNYYLEGKYNDLLDERKTVDEKSARYDELTLSIQQMEGQMNEYQQKIKAFKGVSDTVQVINKLIDEAAGLIYMDDLKVIHDNDIAIREIERVLDRVDTWSKDMHRKIKKADIIEGEFING